MKYMEAEIAELKKFIEITVKKSALDNMLLSMSSIIGILFTIIAALISKHAILYFTPLLIPGVFLPVYFGYYRVLIKDSLEDRVKGWTLFIHGVILYFISMLPLVLRPLESLISAFIVLAIISVLLMSMPQNRHVLKFLRPVDIICNALGCDKRVQ